MNTATASRSTRSNAWRAWIALAATGGLLAVSVVVSAPVAADNYPSWSDVVAARSSEASKASEVQRITQLISGLQSQVSAAQSAASARWEENQTAQTAFNEATFAADRLASEASAAQVKADASHTQAALLAAQFARSGGNDLSSRLFVEGDKADDLLYQLGAMSKLSESTTGIYQQAKVDQNTATSLSEQAKVARDALGALASKAQSALDDAVSAQQIVGAALIEQQNHESELSVQLQALTSAVDFTEADYNAGVQAASRAKQAADEAASKAAAAAATPPATATTPAAPADGGGSTAAPAPSVPSTPSAPSAPSPVVNPPQGYDGNAVVAYAEQFVGVVPYGWGADPSDSFGCDGLTQYVYKQFGINLPRYVPTQAAQGIRVSSSDARAGDAVVWSGHIGIYDGHGGVIHSPDWGRYVTHASSLWGSYYFVRFV
ncbi:C40 family peptidase [Agreia sp. COWG]|uniref:C40 family peptidase n=1 Tax=Agreia sp. COWG TaxID=2773266 RepID=UPI0019268BDD|nr:NlpC/P60 family protein [Agreia sp. COWG]CAD5997864.1 NLPC_P60 domain-containing protein [Agreia sp. COWG]